MKAAPAASRPPLVLAALLAALLGGLPSALHAESAAAARLAGLESAKGTTRFAAAFSSALELVDTVDELVALVDRYAPELVDPAARREAWTRAAETLELSGRFDEAAERYGKAAAAVPGTTDAGTLLAAASCWLQAGECERALAMAELAALASPDPGLDWSAGLVVAWARVCEGDPGRARSALDALKATASDPARKAAVLLLAWALADGEGRASLATELVKGFPGSPEALVAAGAVPVSPFWYLAFPRRASAPVPASSSPAPAVPGGAVATAPSASAAPSAVDSPRAYQVGLFADRTNAERLASSLGAKGFVAVLESRDRPGSAAALAVLVPVVPGADPAALLLRLKDSGFEAWPVF